jgi:ABC-type bacteriocin/lantibiotic exporter with double-glycine peptidase domain
MLERRDLAVIATYAAASGLVSLAVPIASQSLVNTVAFTALMQPLVVLTVLVFIGLAVGGFTSTIQHTLIDRLHQRFFVRAAHDIARRLLDADVAVLRGRVAPDLTNRFFDVVVVQKAASTLLVDGLSAVLSAAISLVLLAFYHPALLAFDLVLLGCITFILLGLGRGGVETAVEESKVKHQMGAWLEQMAGALVAFKGPPAAEFAFRRADALAKKYVRARSLHFGVLLRQLVASHLLQALATATLLGLGGALVIKEQLTLGQLVAAEIAVTGVLASLAKSSKSLESFYDLTAALDKVGSLVDLPSERRLVGSEPRREEAATLALMRVDCAGNGGGALHQLSFTASRDAWLAILTDDSEGRSTLVSLLYGLWPATSGRIELDGRDYRSLDLEALRADIVLVRESNLFNGTLADNLSWGRKLEPGLTDAILDLVELTEPVLSLPDGMDTAISSAGEPLSEDQALRLTLARGLASNPRVLLLDGVLDVLGVAAARRIAGGLRAVSPNLTLIVLTNRSDIAELFGNVKRLRGGRVEGSQEAA